MVERKCWDPVRMRSCIDRTLTCDMDRQTVRASTVLPYCHVATSAEFFSGKATRLITETVIEYLDYIVINLVLWHCWLSGRKGIWPVKHWVVGCWIGYLSVARCRLAYGPVDSTATHSLLFQQNPDWFYLSVCKAGYQLNGIVPAKGR